MIAHFLIIILIIIIIIIIKILIKISRLGLINIILTYMVVHICIFNRRTYLYCQLDSVLGICNTILKYMIIYN